DRAMRSLVAAVIAIVLLAACSGSGPEPPVGRWEGFYSGAGVMIAARVEIGKGGRVRMSAPNAFMDFANMPEADKADVQRRLMASLASDWAAARAHRLDFDGHTFRNPGGVAPQLEWDAGTNHMTMFVYPGTKPTVRIELEPVKDFSN